MATNVGALGKWAGALERSRVVIEVGGQSPWISRVLKTAGHEVIVADPRRLGLIARGGRKNDRRDAEVLARVGRMDPTLLNPVEHREARTQERLAAEEYPETRQLRQVGGVGALLVQSAQYILGPFGKRAPCGSGG